MNEQTSHNPEPSAEGHVPSTSSATPGEPTVPAVRRVPAVDRVPGDPPVPITVWRTAASPNDPPAGLPQRLAYRLVAAYSRPGEAVLDLTDGHVLTEPCSRGGRYHQRGWFTDACSLIVGPLTPPPPRPTSQPPRDAPAPRPTGHPITDQSTAVGEEPIEAGSDPAEVAAWFGDDLFDDLPPLSTVGPAPAATPQIGLAVAQWPRDEPASTSRVRLAWLMSGCARLLRRGGCLVVVTAADSSTSPADSSTPDLGMLVSAGNQAGLSYLQHIVAVYADTNGDQFLYYASDTDLHTLTDTAGHRVSVAHIRVHADLVVLVNRHDGAARGGDTDA